MGGRNRKSKALGGLWGTSLAFLAGYAVAYFAHNASYATAAVVLVTVPFGSMSPTILKGALTGLGAGLGGTMGIVAGLLGFYWWTAPSAGGQTVVTIIAVTTIASCVATGALFAWLGRRRRRRQERQRF